MTIEELITEEVNNAEIRIDNHPRRSEERIYSRGIRDMGNYILRSLPTLDPGLTPYDTVKLLSRACERTDCDSCDFLQHNRVGSPYCWLWESKAYPRDLYDTWMERNEKVDFCSMNCPERETCHKKGEFLDDEMAWCKRFSERGEGGKEGEESENE